MFSWYIVAFIVVAAIAAYLVFGKMRENFSDLADVKNEIFMKPYYDNGVMSPSIVKKFPYFGTGRYAGLRCLKSNNVGCNTIWQNGKLVELTPFLKTELSRKYGITFV
jgi:hypothetical protein